MRRSRIVLAFVALLALIASSCGSDPEFASPTEVKVNHEPIAVLPAQIVAIDIDGNGVESVELDASASTDLDGEIVSYRWSDGLEDVAVSAVFTADFEVGEHVATLTITDDDGLVDFATLVVRVLEPYTSTPNSPVIDVWLGTQMSIGAGRAQPLVNVQGNVSDPDTVGSLVYSLNGRSARSVSMGPNQRRLVQLGDFNIDISRELLVEGSNTVEIRATDTFGEVTTALVQVDNPPPDRPELPLVVDWSSQGLDGLVEVVDGNWKVIDGEVVIDNESRGYDRLLAIGDLSWSDFDMRTTVTIDEIATEINDITSVTPGFGLLMRWNGHNDSVAPGSQPLQGFRPDGGTTPTPIGGFPFYAFEQEGLSVLEIQDPSGTVVTSNLDVQVAVGVEYNLRSQVQSLGGSSGSVYRVKLWRAGSAEPATWMVSYVAGNTSLFEPPTGSLILVAHEVSARFGNVTVDVVPESEILTAAEVNALRAVQS